jgi:hypothetical protein
VALQHYTITPIFHFRKGHNFFYLNLINCGGFMCRLLIMVVLFLSLFSITILAQRDSGRRPPEQKMPVDKGGVEDRTGSGDRIAQPKPIKPVENPVRISNPPNDRDRPEGYPERPPRRPNPTPQPRDPAPDPEPVIIEPVIIVIEEIIICCPPDDPIEYYPPYEEPDYPAITRKMEGIEYFKEENYLKALGLFCDAIVEDPTDTTLYFYRGCTNVKLGNYLWAIEDLDIYLIKFPEDLAGLYYRGLAKYYNKDRESAYLDFDFAMELGDPRSKIFLKRYY